ncbi:MAG: hypothetical protein DRN06_01910 [Thermoprotei archaeon]|nr:MAG: hypothetical protein DRN06_01910 [Thermoprotei archaeon]
MKWVIFGLLSGLLGGIAGIAFTVSLKFSIEFFLDLVNQARSQGLLFMVALIPFAGGLAVGLLNYLLDKDAFYIPCSTDGMIELVHLHHGYTNPGKGVLKILTASLTIGTGGSAGRECPMAYSGSAVAAAINLFFKKTWLGRFMKFTRRDAKIVAICGAAGALGGIFSAPLGGGIFASEVLYSEDVEVEALPSALISSVVGFLLFNSLLGSEPLVTFPKFHDMLILNPNVAYSLFHVAGMALLGLVSVIAAALWTKIFYAFHYPIRDSKIPRPLRPAIGGLLDGLVVLLGLLMLGELYLWGMGYWVIQETIDFTELLNSFGHLLIWVFLLLYFGKILASTFSIASAGAGGVIVPSLFCGAMIGGAYALALDALFPEFIVRSGAHVAYIVAGMAALYAAAGRVPMATILLLCETCSNFSLFAPMLIASMISFLVAKRLNITIYPSQLTRRPGLTRRKRFLDLLLWFIVILIGTALYFSTGIVL